MLFDFGPSIEYVSLNFTLKKGDLIYTARQPELVPVGLVGVSMGRFYWQPKNALILKLNKKTTLLKFLSLL